MFGNLHGCAQQYGDRTQTAWLGGLSSSIYKTRLQPGHNVALMPFSGEVITAMSGRLESPVIRELSGLATSRLNPAVFWAVNDSGNLPELFAIKRDGRHLASFTLPFKNRDWEDLASFEDKGRSWLLIADSGDNLRISSQSKLHILPEPVLPQSSQTITAHKTVVFRYEDGPQNVESMAVSVKERLIFLVSKNSGYPKVYAIPLDAATSPDSTAAPVLAKLVGQLKPLSWTEDDPWLEKVLASRILLGATSMDISADDSLAVIGNYRHAYLYRREPGQSWLQAFQVTPQIVTAHRLAQSESVAFSGDARSILIGSEGRHAPLLTVNSENH